MGTRIEIQKKTKPVVFLAFMIIVLLIVGASAIWVLMSFVFPRLHGFLDLKISAVAAIAGLTIWAISLIIQQSSKTKPGLIIDEQGITDYSSVASVGFIPWSDITSVQEGVGAFRRKLIILIVKKPEVYINKNALMRDSRQIQYQQFGSPIVIMTDNLEYDTQMVLSTLKSQLVRVSLGYGKS